jgi:hypothetical protein
MTKRRRSSPHKTRKWVGMPNSGGGVCEKGPFIKRIMEAVAIRQPMERTMKERICPDLIIKQRAAAINGLRIRIKRIVFSITTHVLQPGGVLWRHRQVCTAQEIP